MFLRILTLTLFCIFFNVNGFSQLKQRVADKHYSNLEYYKASGMYEELANKFIKKGKGNVENIRRAAICNARIFRYNESLQFDQILYSKYNSQDYTEADMLRYIHSLRITGQYDKASELTQVAKNRFSNNPTFARWSTHESKMANFFADSSMNSTQLMPFNSDLGDFAPFQLNDELIFASKAQNRGFLVPRYGWDNGFYLNLMKVEKEGEGWSKPQVLKHNFYSRAHDGPVSFTPDGNEMVLTRNIMGKKKGKDVMHLALYFSTKDSEGNWSDLVAFEHNENGSNTGHATYTPDGSRIYFVSDREGGIGGTDLYYSDRNGKSWSKPVLLGKHINTERDEMFPNVNVAGMLYFASDGHFGLGGLDVFMVNPNMENAQPQNMGYPINTQADDFGLIADSLGTSGYFSSNRTDFVDRIYSWERRLPKIMLEGTVYAIYTEHEPVPEQLVNIIDHNSNETHSIVTDEAGHYEFPILPNHSYTIQTRKEFFLLIHPENFSTDGLRNDTTIVKDLFLNPTTITVKLVVKEKGTKIPVPNAKLSVVRIDTGKDTVFQANENGVGELTVDRHQSYWARASKKGYIDGESAFETGSQSGKVVELELELPKIKKNEKFKLENIFYDLNKATLRPESMASLDKLAEFLLENNLKIELSAHTDSRGSDSYNMRLSQQRAQSCATYLISKGVPKYNIIAKGYGETQLVNRCKNNVQCTEDEHQENRRTEVKILELK